MKLTTEFLMENYKGASVLTFQCVFVETRLKNKDDTTSFVSKGPALGPIKYEANL